MSPCQQAIQVSDLRVQFVVSLRADGDNAVRANCPNVGCHVENAAIRDFFAVPDIHKCEFALSGGIHEDGGNDQGTKIVSLAGLIDADALYSLVVRLIRHRRMALVEGRAGAQ